jgi:multiple sugar transport system permease protein
MALNVVEGTEERDVRGRGIASKNRRRRGDGRTAAGFLAPSLGGFAIFTLGPIIASIVVAFTVWPTGGSPTAAGFSNFVRLFTSDPNFIQSLKNTLIFVFAYVPLNIVVSLALATWISPRIRGQNAYRVLLFIPVVTPMVANAAVWQLALLPSGVIDGIWVSVFGVHAPNFLGSPTYAMAVVVLMSLWQGLGYNLMVFVSALEAVPESMLEAAAIDGASTVQQFFQIKVPMISPAIFFGTTMTVITSFQVFVQPFVLTAGGPGNSTSTLVIYLYRSGFLFHKLGYASAIGVCLFVIILAVTGIVFLAQKRLVHYE